MSENKWFCFVWKLSGTCKYIVLVILLHCACALFRVRVTKGEATTVIEKCQIALPAIWRHISSSYSVCVVTHHCKAFICMSDVNKKEPTEFSA
jgi:hypothetical protein